MYTYIRSVILGPPDSWLVITLKVCSLLWDLPSAAL